MGITHRKYIHNINKKRTRITCPTGEYIIVLIGIKEMYISIPENRFSVIVIESISADGKTIPPVVIIPGIFIIISWFSEKITGHELIIISLTVYTNKRIILAWLKHFIKYNNYRPDKP
jgi:hypothetical protein